MKKYFYLALFISAILFITVANADNHPKSVGNLKRMEIPKFCTECHPNPEYEESIHGKALKDKGLSVVAICTDCHNIAKDKFLDRRDIPKTCAKCHEGIYNIYKTSIHGKKLLLGNKDVPVCTDCHGEHTIKSSQDKSSSTYSQNIPKTCSKCHANEKLSKVYRFAARRLSTYQKSYHGIALKYGKIEVAECASCHGFHDVLPSLDPNSSVNIKNIPKTCGVCHSGAGKNFARGKIHIDPLGEQSGIIFIINLIYKILIISMMIGFSVMIILDLFRRLKNKND